MDRIYHFPGMPKFTRYVRGLSYKFDLRVNQNQGHLIDEVSFDVYFGEHQRGRFTIRRNGNRIERNLLMTYPDGRMVQVGTGGTVFDDTVRQIEEWLAIFFKELKLLAFGR